MKKKLFYAFLSVLLIELAISSILSVKLIRSNYERDIESELLRSSKLLDSFFSELNITSISDYQKYVSNFSKKINFRITLVSSNGEVIADSDINSINLDNHSNREEIAKALSGNIGVSKRHSNTLKRDLFYLAYPTNLDNISVIRLSKPIREIKEDANSLYIVFAISLISGLIFALLISVFFIKSINKPISKLKKTSIAIANGELGKTVNYSSSNKDEITELSKYFNKMSITLKDNFEKNIDENIKSKAILSSMKIGLIAFDSNNKIIAVNKAAEIFFKTNENHLLGKEIEALFEHRNVNENLYDCLKNFKDSQNIEINFDVKRTLSINYNYIYANDGVTQKGILLIAEDVTDIRKLETMRKDFVANVSHEIGTPLTSIKGFAEILSDEDLSFENRKKFANIILLESERLRALTKDLLSLSDIEALDNKMPKETININHRIKSCLEMLAPIAKNKNIKLETIIDENLPNILGKPNWFDQILINLIDNAIKYTPKNGKVKVSITKDQEKISIIISDTGIGIPNDDLNRIFERFYRVDKARSRKEGGTGLGLAIVKHIVIAFNGKISVKSKLNIGTTFTVYIPFTTSPML
jgi:two-component system phosphate regulon sensor histidine kinase PhoR